ncbi:MAG: alcohol dehydrogenase catalytic domain-containing protein [Caldicoprobacterales bacterium]|jgi:2-desacetyl-2-hydroxyethyl bacteriochlorophyllide A dehydrogenase|nr:alcohol dehydrogenase catalytic domain-containing protein [Clostridiales bacterium]
MSEKMRAAVFEGNGVLEIKEVDKPVITKPDDVIVEVETCSICGTDVHIMSVPPGYIAAPGTILGHELVGKVVEVGDRVTSLKVGDRVVTNPNDYCGVCKYCQKNLPNLCEHIIPMGIEADGGFAEYVRVSEKVAHKISDDLPAEIAAFAEPLACLINGVNKIPVKPADSVLVMGAGVIGLLFTQIMKACGASPIIVSEPAPMRREFAKKCGADFVIDPFTENLEEFVLDKTGIGVDYAIDVVGSQMWTGIKAVRKGGKVLLFGFDGKAKLSFEQYHITNREISILGTWLANASFPQAVKILESGMLNLEPLITHKLPLEKTAEGIEILGKGEGIEVLIYPNL